MPCARVWLALLGVASVGLAAPQATADEDVAEYRRGLLPMTAAERQWFRDNCREVRLVRPNRIGLDRINARRFAFGVAQSAAPAAATGAAFGEEFIADGLPGAGPLPLDGGLPSAVDNSTLNAFPPIASQGYQGSCAAFSTVYYQATHNTALVRGWDAKHGGNAYHFSPKWTYNMANNGADSGSYISVNMAILRDHGGATWAEFPYSGSTSDVKPWCLTPTVWRTAIGRRMQQYYTIDFTSVESGLSLLKSTLNNGYVAGFQSSSPWTYYNGWIQKYVGNDPATTNDNPYVGQQICGYAVQNDGDAGHAMTIVGYNDDIWCDLNANGVVDSGEKGALKIANSWGAGWGNSGYAWVAYDALHVASTVTNGPNPSNRRSVLWMAYIVTAKASYSPTQMARVTVRHAKRYQMTIQVGRDAPGTNAPAVIWSGMGLSNDGGDYAFDGSTTALDGTFYLDMTDLGIAATTQRYFVGMADRTVGTTGEVKSFTLVDMGSGTETTVARSNAPAAYSPTNGMADGSTAWAWIDHAFEGALLSVTASDPEASEPGTDTGAFTIARAGRASDPLTVLYTVSGTASNGVDYAALTGSVTLAGSATSVVVTVTPQDDADDETGETVVLQLTESSNYVLDAASSATVTVYDDDGPGEFQFDAAGYSIGESNGPVAIRVLRRNGAEGAASVTFATTNGVARAGFDYNATNGTFAFAGGETARVFQVAISNDAESEANETFGLTLSDPTGGPVLGALCQSIVTIVDDDRHVASFPFTEDFESGLFANYWNMYSNSVYSRILLTTSNSPHGGSRHLTMDSIGTNKYALNELILSIDLAGQQDVALRFWHKEFSDSDHAMPGSFQGHTNADGVALSVDGTNWFKVQGLIDADGIKSTYKAFEIPLDPVMAAHGLIFNENVRIKFQQYDRNSIGTRGFAFDDISVYHPPGQFRFIASAFTADEEDGLYMATVERVNGRTGSASVDYITRGLSASNGLDFTATTGTLFFADGETSQAFAIPILSDSLDESNETVRLMLTNALGGAAIASPSNVVLTIVDDDGPGRITLSGADWLTAETNGTVEIGGLRVEGRQGAVSVEYVTSNGTAVGGADFVTVTGVLTFADGETSNRFTVTLLNDTLAEAREWFSVALRNPAGGAALDQAATGSIWIVSEDGRLFYEPMDTDPHWTTTSLWAYGIPMGGSYEATAGYNGERVYAYNLDGDYEYYISGTNFLTTTAIDCSGYTNLTLAFQRWLGVDEPSYDRVCLQFSTNGTKWTTLWTNSAMVWDFEWTYVAYPLPATADRARTLYLRWGLGPTDGNFQLDGWNIDEVELFGTANHPPVARILAPFDGAEYVQRESCAFVGSATDAEDPVLTNCYWLSDRNGRFATGASNTVSTLSTGRHAITFCAVDSLNATGTAAIALDVWADSTTNGLPDPWESRYWPGGGSGGANADPDHDRRSNYEEWMAGTDPTNTASCFAIQAVLATGGESGPALRWPCTTSRLYTVYCATNAIETFGTLTNGIRVAAPCDYWYTDTVHAAASQLFYQIRVGR